MIEKERKKGKKKQNPSAMIFGIVVVVSSNGPYKKYMKKERKKNPSSDSRIVIHEPDIPRGATGSEDELGVAFGAFYCALVGGFSRIRTGVGHRSWCYR